MRFVGRHVSVLRALLAYGLAEAEARGLVERAKGAGQAEIRITVGGRVMVFRRMRGNHADVYELSASAEVCALPR